MKKNLSITVGVTQDVFVEGAGEVDVDQLAVVESQAQDLTRKAEVVEVVRVHGRITVGLKGGTYGVTQSKSTHTQYYSGRR